MFQPTRIWHSYHTTTLHRIPIKQPTNQFIVLSNPTSIAFWEAPKFRMGMSQTTLVGSKNSLVASAGWLIKIIYCNGLAYNFNTSYSNNLILRNIWEFYENIRDYSSNYIMFPSPWTCKTSLPSFQGETVPNFDHLWCWFQLPKCQSFGDHNPSQ